MAGRIAYYGGIVTNGLVLDLDAAKKDSYPGTGTSWRDISGNSNNGTLVNGPTFNSNNGGSIVFDGVDDRVTISNPSIPLTGNWSVSSWFNLSSLPTTDNISNFYSQYIGEPGNGRMILLLRNETGTVNKFQIFLGSGPGYSNQFITGVTTALTNTVYNLVAIRNGNTFNLYLNSNLENSQDLTGKNINILQSTPEIGGILSGNFGWTNGKIYSTQIYNRALSSSEVFQNYNALKGRYGL